MKIKIDKADTKFSQFIRLRDKRCVRCFSEVEVNENGMPVTHEASHYHGRGRESTRFDIENVDTLCVYCHRFWGSDDKEGYREFKLKQLGEKGFKDLRVRSVMYHKKDRATAYLYAKSLFDALPIK